MTARSARNPQAEQMAHESMVRTLTSQAEAIWPQEREILTRYSLPRDARVLDVGCGTGEALLRLAHENPGYRLTGVDLHEPHLTRAREQARPFGTRVRIELGDAFALDCPDGSYDLTLCRHLLQAVPDPELVLAELKRVTRPGGILHLLVEDYGMIHCHPCAVDADRFWREGPMVLGERLGTDLLAGRKAWSWLQALGLTEVRVEYLVVDTVRVARPILVRIFEAWRDGYTEVIAAHSRFSPAEVRHHFDAIIASFGDPAAYGVWLLPVLSARVPA